LARRKGESRRQPTLVLQGRIEREADWLPAIVHPLSMLSAWSMLCYQLDEMICCLRLRRGRNISQNTEGKRNGSPRYCCVLWSGLRNNMTLNHVGQFRRGSEIRSSRNPCMGGRTDFLGKTR
jgi:hypothetical protein